MTEPKLYPGISDFNCKPSKLMHIDLNSCFASIEQQSNPKLRGLPTVVAAYPTDGGCILSASVEAKKLGIKTGMRVKDARNIYRTVKVLTPDPPKYRYIHQQMMKVFETYTPNVEPKSIDEAVIIFDQIPDLTDKDPGSFLFNTAGKIKNRIKSEIGEWLTVSIGLGPNRFLAKTAASIKKPDGLEEINFLNAEEQLTRLELIDLCGINKALKLRLNLVGVFTPVEFLHADLLTLKTVFKSVWAYHWYKRLRGFETDDWKSSRKSIGHSYALPHQTADPKTLSPILHRLCEKVGQRLRNNGYEASGINLDIVYKDWTHGGRRHKLPQPIFASSDIYHQGLKILNSILLKGSTFSALPDLAGGKVEPLENPIRNVSVSVFALSKSLYQQQVLFENQSKKESLVKALDQINNKYGEFTITVAPLVEMKRKILDCIAFGGILDMETVI